MQIVKKILVNFAAAALLPVILLGFLWEVTLQAWEMGSEFAEIAADWLNHK